jgi:hypothetical protein
MLGELAGQMRQARDHVERATAMVAQALTELTRAAALIQLSLQESSDQSPSAAAEQTRQQLTEAHHGATATATAIDETLARWGVTGSPGN